MKKHNIKKSLSIVLSVLLFVGFITNVVLTSNAVEYPLPSGYGVKRVLQNFEDFSFLDKAACGIEVTPPAKTNNGNTNTAGKSATSTKSFGTKTNTNNESFTVAEFPQGTLEWGSNNKIFLWTFVEQSASLSSYYIQLCNSGTVLASRQISANTLVGMSDWNVASWVTLDLETRSDWVHPSPHNSPVSTQSYNLNSGNISLVNEIKIEVRTSTGVCYVDDILLIAPGASTTGPAGTTETAEVMSTTIQTSIIPGTTVPGTTVLGTTQPGTSGKYISLNPYEKVDWKDFGRFKMASHVHTGRSDGSFAVTDMLNMHYAQDFDIVALTDHSVLSNKWSVPATGTVYIQSTLSAQRETEFFAGEGRDGKVMYPIPYTNEPSTSDHVNTFWANFVPSSGWTMETNIKRAEDLGGISHINHPGRYGDGMNGGTAGENWAKNPAVAKKIY